MTYFQICFLCLSKWYWCLKTCFVRSFEAFCRVFVGSTTAFPIAFLLKMTVVWWLISLTAELTGFSFWCFLKANLLYFQGKKSYLSKNSWLFVISILVRVIKMSRFKAKIPALPFDAITSSDLIKILSWWHNLAPRGFPWPSMSTFSSKWKRSQSKITTKLVMWYSCALGKSNVGGRHYEIVEFKSLAAHAQT